MTFGLTPQGFNKKRLPDEKSSEENALISQFGDINVQAQSVFGQFIGVMSKIIADYWENLEDVYYSQYPDTAEGISLDYIVALNGITRLAAERTSVVGVCLGFESTLIPQGALARQPDTNEVFFAENDTIISSNNAVENLISVDALASQIYNTVINSNSYFYSLPKIEFNGEFETGCSVVVSINGTELASVPFDTDSQTTITNVASAIQADASVSSAVTTNGLVISFDSDFVSSNSILPTINGVALSPVLFNTDQATTMADLATAITADSNVTSCSVTDTRELTIVPVDEGTFIVDSIITTGGATQPTTIDHAIRIVPQSGYSVKINYVTTTGGASNPDAAISVLQPTTINSVVSALVAIINNGVDPVSATDNLDGTFEILANDSSISYSLSVNSNMTIETVYSPVIFLSENYGEIAAPIGSLTEILSPINGWQSITNLLAGTLGRDIETDAELRLRRKNSIRILGAGTVEAIRARILQEVTGVTQALIFENRTMTETNIIVVFSQDFVTGNEIVFTINGTPQPTINFSTDELTTQQLIQTQLEAIEGIESVSIGGTGNRTLTISLTQGYEMVIDSITITGGASQTEYNLSGGRYPKSFEAVIEGGSDEDIANKIWQTKPAGIQTFGNTSYTIIDSQGDNQVINFSRPTPIYIWITVDLTLNTEETFPTNGTTLVEQAIVDYGNTLNIGDDVLIQRVLSQIFNVTGISSGNMQIASTLNPTDSPVYGSSNITIAENQLAIFSLDRTDAEVV